MFKNLCHKFRTRGLELFSANVYSCRKCHDSSNPISRPPTPYREKISHRVVALFWDLNRKLPDSFPPYVTATRVRFAVSLLGKIHNLSAYGGPEVFSKMAEATQVKKKRRKKHNQIEKRDRVEKPVPFLCRLCGRLFRTNEKRVDHFKKMHEPEHLKRLNQIESARGGKRVNLVGRYSMKMEKFKNAKREILASISGCTLADELGRAGFHVHSVMPHSCSLLRNHMVDVMEMKKVDCVVLLSDDSTFVGLIKQAKEWGVKTFVVSNTNDDLKRHANAGYSWKDLLFGKVMKQAPKVSGRWDDQDALKGLEWTYEQVSEHEVLTSESRSRNGSDAVEEFIQGEREDACCKKDTHPWWELSDT